MTSETPTATRGVVPRALAVLRTMAASREAQQSVSGLARSTGIPQQTVHRLLSDLAAGGLVLRDSRTRRWTLGPFALTLGAAAERQISWTQTARSVLEEVTGATRETTILTLRDGAYASHTDIIESPQRLRLTEHVGLRHPLTVGASRRAIFASLPGPERDSVLEQLAVDGVVVDTDRLTEECNEIREQGYAVSGSEVSDHTVGVAVPVFRSSEPVASLLAAGPEYRMTEDAIASTAQILRDKAEWLSILWSDPANR